MSLTRRLRLFNARLLKRLVRYVHLKGGLMRIQSIMSRSFWLIALVMVSTIPMTPMTFADDESDYAADALLAANDIAWSKMFVKILDPEEQPVEGVIVRPWALRAGNGHGAWDSEQIGAPVTTKTDANGIAEIVYPISVNWGLGDPVTVSEVSMFLSHSGYCTRNVHVGVPGEAKPPGVENDVRELNLKRGIRLRIAGVVMGSDQPLPDCHVLLEGEASEREFVQENDGWMQSIPVSEERRWFRVVHAPAGKPPQFSKLMAWSPDDPTSLEVRVEVRPGARVLGKISDAVPRPITRGRVVVWCGSPARREEGANRAKPRASWWYDHVPIAEDGTFEFSSLPSGYLAQFYAMANDWISAQPTDEAYEVCCKWFAEENHKRNDFFRNGQVLRLAGGETQITLEMEPAGQVRVKCTDPDGRPLVRIEVSCWPNQYMVGGGSTLLCIRQSSLDRLKGQGRIEWSRDNPFSAETNAEGEVLIRNLPQGNQGLYAGNAVWKSQQEEHKFDVQAEKTTEITLVFQRSR